MKKWKRSRLRHDVYQRRAATTMRWDTNKLRPSSYSGSTAARVVKMRRLVRVPTYTLTITASGRLIGGSPRLGKVRDTV